AATVARYLAARGLVVPEPRKRPKSSYIRFAAEQPNECWQAGFTHYPLAGGTGTEILTWLDDHSRLALRVTAWHRVTGPVVLAEFRAAADVVDLAHPPRLEHPPDRPAMIVDIEPISHVLSVAVDRQRFALQRIEHHQGD